MKKNAFDIDSWDENTGMPSRVMRKSAPYGFYVIPSVQKFAFECLSVCPSVSQSVRPASGSDSFPLSLLSIFLPIFFKLCIRVDIRKEWFGSVNK